jgi:autophagy-related protein 2
VEEDVFRNDTPQVGPTPELVDDDVPTNLDYLDDSFGAAGGLRAFADEDEFSVTDARENSLTGAGLVSALGGETIRMLVEEPLRTIEHYYNTLPPEAAEIDNTCVVVVSLLYIGLALITLCFRLGDTKVRLRIHNCDLEILLYDGFDWPHTRKTIEDETRAVRRRLAKIRQMLANGQTYEPGEETGALLFNSVYVGLEEDIEGMNNEEAIAAIDEELQDDAETASQGSWQSLKPPPRTGKAASIPTGSSKTLSTSRASEPSIEVRLLGSNVEVDQYRPDQSYASRILATVCDLEILDRMKTSTWSLFLTDLRSDIRGNVRETNSNMVRVELINVRPVPDNPAEEARLRVSAVISTYKS